MVLRAARVMVVVAAATVSCSCDRGEGATPPPPLPTVPSLAQATPPKATAVPEAVGTTTDAQSDSNIKPACEKPVAVSPRALSAAWPSMVGRRVSFVGRIRRSLGFGEALVATDGARFDVLLSPSDVWVGAARRTYRVTGSSTVHLAGPTRLPQLLLDAGGCSGG